ncbi:MAG TPA: DinB family protein [Herpetosiphonaceae bacterium]
MDANAFRHVFDYHFAENRALWDSAVASLSDAQFAQNSAYSHGSVRDQLIHMISVDEAWFSGLRGVELGEPEPVGDRQSIRAYADRVEAEIRAYLGGLRDEMLLTKPIEDGEDKDLAVWQMLFQVINHGTDHRAQLLRLLNDLGITTSAQDYIFYAYDHPVAAE